MLSFIYEVWAVREIDAAGGRVVHEEALIRYRITRLQQSAPIVVGDILACVIIEIALLVNRATLSSAEVRQMLIALLCVGLVLLILPPGRYGVALTPEAAVVYGVRKRVIEWRCIVNILVEKDLGDRVVILWDDRGQRIKLLAPRRILDRKFNEKVRVIQACWQGQYDWNEKRQAATCRNR